VFERFWRGVNGDKATGSGIGLAVVAELVAAHHGSVAAGNGPGGGARLTVTMPAAPAE
jgi:signal transduction histidine kinase